MKKALVIEASKERADKFMQEFAERGFQVQLAMTEDEGRAIVADHFDFDTVCYFGCEYSYWEARRHLLQGSAPMAP